MQGRSARASAAARWPTRWPRRTVSPRSIVPSFVRANRSRGRSLSRRQFRRRGGGDLRCRGADRPELARGEPAALDHGLRAGGTLPCSLCRAGARPAADARHRSRAETARGERPFGAAATLRSRGAVGGFRRLQRAGAKAASSARRAQRVDARTDRGAGRGAAPSCARAARRIRPVAHRHRGAGRRRRPYRGARMPGAARRMPGHLAHDRRT